MGELPLTRSGAGASEDGADQRDDEPVLPTGSPDERVGWGDDPSDPRREREFYEAERPPHHE
jgi:hypothetical protein